MAENRTAVSNSTTKYLAEILRPQQRALPRKNSQDSIGMFSQNGIGVPHSHLDLGNMTDCPAGIRHMHTFRKLPTQAPSTKA
jgi:hypothetical protein